MKGSLIGVLGGEDCSFCSEACFGVLDEEGCEAGITRC